MLRRSCLDKLKTHTGRDVIHYTTAWSENKIGIPPESLSIVVGDVQGFMEAVHGHEHEELDLILHSPGGSADTTEQIVVCFEASFGISGCLSRWQPCRRPRCSLCQQTRSGWAHTLNLSRFNPQFQIMTPEGPRAAPGQAILDQFEQAKLECQDPESGAWLPILRRITLPG